MKRKNSRSHKKLAILPIMVAAMLVFTGVAYAYWYDKLTIHGEITTNDFNCELSLPTDWYVDCEWKDVVDEEDISFIWEHTGLHPDAYDKITITIDGAYPSYHGVIKIGIVSRGSVPAHIKGDPVINKVPELEVWLDEYIPGQPLDERCLPPYTDPFPDCWQLHQQEFFFLIHFHVYENDDPNDGPIVQPKQGETYSFSITLPLIQYNYDTDCFDL
jgi:predicted ribosomally synthesized peptide with SipW-like signal peptide